MSIVRTPELGVNTVELKVRLAPPKPSIDDRLATGLQALYQKGIMADVQLVCAERTFLAHRVVLASQSEVFKEGLTVATGTTAPPARQEVRLADIDNPEAVQFMLDFIYEIGDAASWKDYNPKTQDINKDVLKLAQNFRLPGLTERATFWLSKDLTTGNVVERLTICEDFGLQELRERILAQLAGNKKALFEVAHSPQIMKYPSLMQALLQQAAGAPQESPQPKKKAKKA